MACEVAWENDGASAAMQRQPRKDSARKDDENETILPNSIVSGLSAASNATTISASKRVQYLHRKRSMRVLTKREREDLRSLRNTHTPHLLMQSYHLPGYTYWEDLGQYLSNNHPVFGICCHHKFHPISNWVRFLSLVGSALFGLAITNIVYISFAFSNYDYNYLYWQKNFDFTTGNDVLDNNLTGIQVTNGNLALWTVGSIVHALYDNVIWELASCSCFMEPGISLRKIQRYQSRGSYYVILLAVLATAMASMSVVVRELVENDAIATTNSTLTDTSNTSNTTAANVTTPNTNTTSGNLDNLVFFGEDSDFNWDLFFLYSYLVELALNYFFYYPVVGLILFTGVLGCGGRIPMLGGRPYEMRVEEMENEQFLQSQFGNGTLPSLEGTATQSVISGASGHTATQLPYTKHAFKRSTSSKDHLSASTHHTNKSRPSFIRSGSTDSALSCFSLDLGPAFDGNASKESLLSLNGPKAPRGPSLHSTSTKKISALSVLSSHNVPKRCDVSSGADANGKTTVTTPALTEKIELDNCSEDEETGTIVHDQDVLAMKHDMSVLHESNDDFDTTSFADDVDDESFSLHGTDFNKNNSNNSGPKKSILLDVVNAIEDIQTKSIRESRTVRESSCN